MDRIAMAQIQLTENEIHAAVNVLRSGALRQGKECEAFENEFCSKVGARHAVTCANGSAALHLAYMVFLQPGDEVLVPSFTFIATGSMVTMCGARPVFCDVDTETFLIDLEDAKKRLTDKTRAIAPVHLFGNPCDIDAVKAFADANGLLSVWDAAQAHGAQYKGRDVGAFGDFVCYSFYPSKNMFVGEGGMICTDNAEFDHKLRFLRSHGQTGKYYHTMLGLNYRMTDVEAAIGREQLKRLDEMLAVRRRNAAVLNEKIAEIPGIEPQKITLESEHAWHQYCVTVDPDRFGCDRATLAERLNDKGIGTGVHYPRGLHDQPIFKEMYGDDRLPTTEFLAANILALPVHHQDASRHGADDRLQALSLAFGLME
jgi:perosamine synthetase